MRAGGAQRRCGQLTSTTHHSLLVYDSPATQSIRVGWPAHFGPCDWLVQALYSRSKDGATPLLKLELRAAGLGGGQGGVVPTHWTRTGQQDAAEERPAPKPSSALLGRARAAAHSEEACLLHVTDGAIKSMLRSAATDQGGLEVLSIAGARAAEGRFADALRDHTALKDLRFRDAPLVSDDAAAPTASRASPVGPSPRLKDGQSPRPGASRSRSKLRAAAAYQRAPPRRHCTRHRRSHVFGGGWHVDLLRGAAAGGDSEGEDLAEGAARPCDPRGLNV